jgi:hypothetical protein
MPALRSQSYVFDARPHYPLLVSVKRYWVPEFESKDADAATLVLAHATSFHKELWEPVLEELYDQVASSSRANSSSPKIRDAWAIDCPNHGESAVLNEETLLSGYTPICKFHAWPYREYKCVTFMESLMGRVRASNKSHSKWVWQRHRCGLHVSEPGRGRSLHGGIGHVSPCIIRLCILSTHGLSP